jgi:hypothetical protein
MDRKANRPSSVFSAKEMMAILSMDFLLYLQKIELPQ